MCGSEQALCRGLDEDLVILAFFITDFWKTYLTTLKSTVNIKYVRPVRMLNMIFTEVRLVFFNIYWGMKLNNGFFITFIQIKQI